MNISKVKYIFLVLLTLGIFAAEAKAKEINLFDGLIKIKTPDDDNDGKHHRDRDDRDNDDGHYVIINGRLVWIEDNRDDHVIDSRPEEWVLLTRIRNDDFDWVIIPASNRHKIKRYLENGYSRSMTGRKESCYKMGQKKERLWKRHHSFWQ